MKRDVFEAFVGANAQPIEEIRNGAWKLHESVGQTYDNTLPYGHHLSMVADAAIKYGHEVIDDEADILPVIFAAYYHDGIEDARLSYNDVKTVARKFMDDGHSVMAAEIIFALTNDKGRSRKERAGEHYYAGIRETPYAPFVKLCDRLANMTHCFNRTDDTNRRMRQVYAGEWTHFIQAITIDAEDKRFLLPQNMIDEVHILLSKDTL